MSLTLLDFFLDDETYAVYSEGMYNIADTGSSSEMDDYLSQLGVTAHTADCYWLGINDLQSVSSIGLLGDWNYGCSGSGPYPYADDLAIGVGLQSCMDANDCYNGGSGHAAGQSRGLNGVDDSGVVGPWHVFGR